MNTTRMIVEKAKDKEIMTEVSVITKHDTFFVDKNGNFVNYSKSSEYDPRYCQKLIDFFNIPPYEEKYMMSERGRIFLGRIANEMPTLSRFAAEIGISSNILHGWAEHNKEFAEAMNQARDFQEYILVTNSLLGLYTPNVAIFSLKNLVGWANEPDMFVSGQITIDGVINKISKNNTSIDLLEQSKVGAKLEFGNKQIS